VFHHLIDRMNYFPMSIPCRPISSVQVVRHYHETVAVSRKTEDDRIELTKPTCIPELSNIKTIAAGQYHCLAIKEDGTVWAWGYNDFGELGDGTTINRAHPVMINDFNVLLPAADKRIETK